MHLSGEADDLAAAQIVMKDGFVGQIADATLDLDAVLKTIETVNSRGTGSRSENAHEHPDRGGLTRAIRAEKCEDLSVRDGQIEIFYGLKSAVAFGQTLDFDQIGGQRGRHVRSVRVPWKRRPLQESI